MDLSVEAHRPAGFDHTDNGQARSVYEPGRPLKYSPRGRLIACKRVNPQVRFGGRRNWRAFLFKRAKSAPRNFNRLLASLSTGTDGQVEATGFELFYLDMHRVDESNGCAFAVSVAILFKSPENLIPLLNKQLHS